MHIFHEPVIISATTHRRVAKIFTFHFTEKMYVDSAILLTKTTAEQNEDALSYHRVRGLYFLAVVFVRSIVKPVVNDLIGGYRK